jgi:hypothetical protein
VEMSFARCSCGRRSPALSTFHRAVTSVSSMSDADQVVAWSSGHPGRRHPIGWWWRGQPTQHASPCTKRCVQQSAICPKWFCTGKRRTLQNDVLEIASYRTRPARQDNERKIRVRGTESRLSVRGCVNERQQAHAAVASRQALLLEHCCLLGRSIHLW